MDSRKKPAASTVCGLLVQDFDERITNSKERAKERAETSGRRGTQKRLWEELGLELLLEVNFDVAPGQSIPVMAWLGEEPILGGNSVDWPVKLYLEEDAEQSAIDLAREIVEVLIARGMVTGKLPKAKKRKVLVAS